MDLHVWSDIVPDGSVRMLAYSFGPGRANTVAVRLKTGSWLVVSPSAGAPEAALDGLDKEGTVTALVAPNAYHHLGQQPWRARFKEAISYAPDGAIPRLTKQCRGVPFRPLSELAALLPPHVGFLVPDGMKNPDALLWVDTPQGSVWYTGDLLSNTTVEDTKAPLRWIFSLLGGGAGFKFNPIPALVYVSSKPNWKSSVKAAMAAHPPITLLPAHGSPLRTDVAAQVATALS